MKAKQEGTINLPLQPGGILKQNYLYMKPYGRGVALQKPIKTYGKAVRIEVDVA